MAAHRTTSTTHWLNSIQSETDIIRPPQLPASRCAVEVNQLNKAKSQLFVVIGKCRLCTIFGKKLYCLYTTQFVAAKLDFLQCLLQKSCVFLLKMDASVLGVKKVQIRYKEKQKGKGSHLRYRVQKVKHVYCKHCSLSHIHRSCRSCLDA